MGWGRFKTFIREYLTYQALNRLQDDIYTKLNYLNDNKIGTSLLASSASPGKIIKTNSDGSLETDIEGNATTACNGIPTGLIAYWPQESIPDGWLECNGAAISRETYSVLYNVIGDKYGEGDGSLTFNLPEIRGEFIRAWSHGRTETKDGNTVEIDDDRQLGSTQSDEFKHHQHLFAGDDVISEDANFPRVSVGGRDSENGNGGLGGLYRTKNDIYNEAWAGDYGGSGGNETRPRNIALMACIFTGVSKTTPTGSFAKLLSTSFTIYENSDSNLVCKVRDAAANIFTIDPNTNKVTFPGVVTASNLESDALMISLLGGRV